MTGQGIARVKPVRRDVKSGHLIPHAAFEGWRPEEPRINWPRLASWALAAAFWIGGAVFVVELLKIPA